MNKVAVKQVSGAVYYLPYDIPKKPESTIAEFIIGDSKLNEGYCCVTNSIEDRDTRKGIYYAESEFASALLKSIKFDESEFICQGEHYSILAYDDSALQKAQKAEKRKIIDYLRNDRNVKYLVHFTPMENLIGIAERGIVPRQLLSSDTAIFTDEERRENLLDCSSFSFTYPNYRMFYKKRRSEYGGKIRDFAVLLINISIIDDIDLNDVYYFPRNAADHIFTYGNQENYHGLNSLKSMFENEVNESSLPPEFPIHSQAEVMIRSIIKPEYIIEVNYQSSWKTRDEIFDRIKELYGDRLVNNSDYFSNRDWYLSNIYKRSNNG